MPLNKQHLLSSPHILGYALVAYDYCLWRQNLSTLCTRQGQLTNLRQKLRRVAHWCSANDPSMTHTLQKQHAFKHGHNMVLIELTIM